METIIRGKCYVVGDDVDTDQIIPAQHLALSLSIPEERKMYARYALSGVPDAGQGLPYGKIPFVRDDSFTSEYKIVVGGKNFGCGSSREHASFCMREAGCTAVIAEFYSRIFFRNSVNGGYLIPFETDEHLSKVLKTGEELELDVKKHTVKNLTTGKSYTLKPIGDVLPIIEAGDVFKYAKAAGMMPQGK